MNKDNKILTVLQVIIAIYLLIMSALFITSSLGLLDLNMFSDGIISHMIILICAVINIKPENGF